MSAPKQALWMLLAAFLFATMGVFVKFASAYVHSFEIVMVRGQLDVHPHGCEQECWEQHPKGLFRSGHEG